MDPVIQITFVSVNKEHLDPVTRELSKCKNHPYMFSYRAKRIDSIDDLQFDVLISPANSFGELKGGIDMAYYKFLGREKIAERVGRYIRNYADGEIHVGDYGIIPIDNADHNPNYLVLCPTMVIPMSLPPDSRNAYYYMRAVLKAVRKLTQSIYNGKNISIMCPIPCVGVGGMNPDLVAKQMRIAVDSMNGMGIIHAVNMTKKEEDSNVFKLPHFYSVEKMQNMKFAYIETTTV